MDAMNNLIQAYKKNTFLRKGLPFLLFVVGGSVFLKYFTTIRYEFRKGKKYSKEEMEELGLRIIDPEQEVAERLEELQKQDLDDWDNIRGPRPWENSKEMQDEQRRQIKEDKEKAKQLAAQSATSSVAGAL